MGQVIIPKVYVKDEDISYPLIFLMGPIRSAPKWHDEAISILFDKRDNITIASPHREVSFEVKKYMNFQGDTSFFPRQRAWERHYLKIASKNGCILCWLPGEDKHDCSKSYGVMTRIELGQIMRDCKYNPSTKFCVGTDGKFSEFHTILYDLEQDIPDIKICNSLEETCALALQIASSTKIKV